MRSVKSASPKKRKSQITKATARHVYYGEDLARPLIAWLNAGGDQLQDAPGILGDQLYGVTGLLEIARRHREEARKPEPNKMRMGVLKGQATAILDNYEFMPVVAEMNDRWDVQWKGVVGGKQARGAPFVLMLLDLAEQGKIHSIRRCAKEDCRQWFFARYPHQRFHSSECQIAALQADPVRREARAKHMRWLRQQKKQRSKRGRK